MATVLLLVIVSIVVLPLSYMAGHFIPYDDERPISSIPKWEAVVLRFICFYPILPLLLMLINPFHVFTHYDHACIFAGTHMVMSMLGAGCSRYVFNRSRWGGVFFVLNVILGCCYGYVFFAIVMGFY